MVSSMLTSDKIEAIRKEVNDELATLRGGDGRSHRFARMASDLLGHIQYLEARAVVVPDDTFTLDLDEFGKGLVCITINSKNRGVGYELCGTMGDGHFSRRTFDITPYLAHCLNTIGVRTIPADCVPGDGMAALRRFAERCAQRDHQPDEHIGSAKCVACEAEDALRANQGEK